MKPRRSLSDRCAALTSFRKPDSLMIGTTDSWTVSQLGIVLRLSVDQNGSEMCHTGVQLAKEALYLNVTVGGACSIELCAGGGGQALGLEQAGFAHMGLVEIDKNCCNTLRRNRPVWQVFETSLKKFADRNAKAFFGADLVAGGLPCPPFSIAGKQLGDRDERDLFPVALEIVDAIMPKAVMIENVKGILAPVFEDYRSRHIDRFRILGYRAQWKLLNASDFEVPQLRPRAVLVAVRQELSENFSWPVGSRRSPNTVGEAIFDLISSDGWKGADDWERGARRIAPTIVGGSLKHGGPDLGPTRARAAWAALGVDGKGIANGPPPADFAGMPRLTVPMVARLQGFPDSWEFTGSKTASYRQVGNAFPPPVARAVGLKILDCLSSSRTTQIAYAAE